MRRSPTRREVLAGVTAALGGCASTTESRPGDGSVSWTSHPLLRAAPDEMPPMTESDRFTALGTTIDTVGPHSEWAAGQGMIAVADDGSDPDSPEPFRGEQSLRVEGDRAAAVTAEFDRPVDFRNRHLSAAVYPDKPDTTDSVVVDLLAPDRENRLSCVWNYHGYFDCGWRRYDFSVDAVYGDPDPSNVRYIQFNVVDNDVTTRCWLDDVRTVPRPDRGKVMFMFDDIAESAFTRGFSVLDEHDLRGSYGVISDVVGAENRMSVDQLRTAEQAGWDLVSHSKTGERLTALDSATQRRYLATAKEWLEEHALRPEAGEHFVFPMAKYGATSLANVGEFHDVAYVGGSGSAAALTDKLTVARRPGELPFENVRTHVDTAARHRNLLALVFHTVDSAFADTFQQIVRYVWSLVDAGEIDVITPTELATLQSNFRA